jgi:hypothetical protein
MTAHSDGNRSPVSSHTEGSRNLTTVPSAAAAHRCPIAHLPQSTIGVVATDICGRGATQPPIRKQRNECPGFLRLRLEGVT